MKYVYAIIYALSILFIVPNTLSAYTYCPLNSSYNYFSDSCECSYGYVRSGTSCISRDQSCKNQYGYNSKSDYAGGCECNSGYVFSNGRCISGDLYCSNKYGSFTSYSFIFDRCECSFDHVWNNAGTKCITKDESCEEDFGYHSKSDGYSSCVCEDGYIWNEFQTSCIDADLHCKDNFGEGSYYDSYSEECDCDNEYVLVDDQCVEGEEYCVEEIGYNSYFDSGECFCDRGYLLYGECIDEDEFCEENYAVGSYYIGGEECECEEGYYNDAGECKKTFAQSIKTSTLSKILFFISGVYLIIYVFRKIGSNRHKQTIKKEHNIEINKNDRAKRVKKKIEKLNNKKKN